MRRIISFILPVSFFCVVCACHKEREDKPVGLDDNLFYASYELEGVENLLVPKGVDTTIEMSLHLKYIGINYYVTVIPEDLPDWVSVFPDSATGFRSFDTTFAFSIHGDSVGVFPAVFTTRPNGKKYEFSIYVQ